jgi:hypothetical protein
MEMRNTNLFKRFNERERNGMVWQWVASRHLYGVVGLYGKRFSALIRNIQRVCIGMERWRVVWVGIMFLLVLLLIIWDRNLVHILLTKPLLLLRTYMMPLKSVYLFFADKRSNTLLHHYQQAQARVQSRPQTLGSFVS